MGLFFRRNAAGEVRLRSSSDPDSPPPSWHRFDRKWVERYMLRGVVTISGEFLNVHSTDGYTYRYKITRRPGAYCLHCGDFLGSGRAQTHDETDLRVAYVKTCQVYNNDETTGNPALGPDGGWYEFMDGYEAELVSHG